MRMTKTFRRAPRERLGTSPRWSLCAAIAWAGVSLAIVGCSEGYDIPDRPAELEMLQGDADCLADNEPSQGDACTQDCMTATCASGMGRRICTCEGGVFLQCACLPPDNWPYDDVPTAPYCDNLTGQPKYLSGERCSNDGQQCISSNYPEQGCNCVGNTWQCSTSEGIDPGAVKCESFGNGLQAVLKDQPCDNEWELCISRDYNPTGTSPRGCACMLEGAALFWMCSATNRWWRAE
jgi:hypothetical protein